MNYRWQAIRSSLTPTRTRAAVVGVALTIICGVTCPAWATWVAGYYPTQGTLPDQQGWTVYDSGGSPAPTVSGGILHQGPTAGGQAWYRTDQPLDFSGGPGNAAVVELRLKVISSSYEDAPPPPSDPSRWLPGYHFTIGDSVQHYFGIGVSSAGLRVTQDNEFKDVTSTAFIPFITTDDFHIYRFTVAGGVGTLSVDGQDLASLSMGTLLHTDPNFVAFGDGWSWGGTSQTELSYLRYGMGPFDDESSAPEPASLLLWVTGGGLIWWRRRR